MAGLMVEGMRAALLLLVIGCGEPGMVPIPNIASPTCAWVEHEVIEPAPICRLLTQDPGTDDARFLTDTDTSCQGVTCLELPAGEQAYILGKLTQGYVEFDSTHIDCAYLGTFCPAAP
jgi:hypothetical protein